MAARYALVLDDDAPLRALVRDALTAEGWTVGCFPRNEAAMHLASRRQPDVVMLDISQPEFAPEALAAGLRIHYGPDLPILATATTPQLDMVRRIQPYSFLAKPFELERLVQLLEKGRNLSERSARLRAHSESALDRMRSLRTSSSQDA